MAGIEDAIQIAAKAYTGMKDIDGKPFILHWMAVGLKGKSDNEIICGILNGIVENTGVTLNDLALAGFSTDIIDTIRLLTHSASVPYMDYIRNICLSSNATAITVKVNDLQYCLEHGTQDNRSVLIGALDYINTYLEEQKRIYENEDFKRIQGQFNSLRVARIKGKKAPHKPVLLLSVMELVNKRIVTENRIFLSIELERLFFQQWDRYVGESAIFQAIIDTPFWHLASESFWTLHLPDGNPIDINETRPLSSSRLRAGVYASLDEGLWDLIMNDKTQNALKEVLIKTIQ